MRRELTKTIPATSSPVHIPSAKLLAANGATLEGARKLAVGVTRKEFAKREEVGLGGRSLAVATGRIALVNVPRVAASGESGANARNPAKEVR